MPTTRITIIRSRKPLKSDLNQDLQWLCQSLGLFSDRDKDRSMFRIFIEMLKAARQKHPLTSDQMAYRTGLSRGTVVHHINKLINAGLITYDQKAYFLRVENLEVLIDEIQSDLMRTLDKMRGAAKRIDTELGL
ncbi:MAG: ArsR family transcriptional regulator [Nanoarchaeota archaeon]|nr:ArsR family transcriptional regulator [Nanoarchaeota archaeon]